MSGTYDNIVDDIMIISKNCKVVSETIGQAYNLINEGSHIVKIPNCPAESIIIHRFDNSYGFLADFVTNFRTLGGKPLGYLNTNAGTVAIPQFWPTNMIIQQKYGLPRRNGETDIMVDAFIVNSYWNQKIYNIKDLPSYSTSGF